MSGVDALRTRREGDEIDRSAAFNLSDRGVKGAWTESEESRTGFDAFFFRLIVTFSKRIESSGRTVGERGVSSEKILKDFFKEESAKEGEVAGLIDGGPEDWGLVYPEVERGGKSASENSGVGEMTVEGVEEGTEFNGATRDTPALFGAEGGQ